MVTFKICHNNGQDIWRALVPTCWSWPRFLKEVAVSTRSEEHTNCCTFSVSLIPRTGRTGATTSTSTPTSWRTGESGGQLSSHRQQTGSLSGCPTTARRCCKLTTTSLASHPFPVCRSYVHYYQLQGAFWKKDIEKKVDKFMEEQVNFFPDESGIMQKYKRQKKSDIFDQQDQLVFSPLWKVEKTYWFNAEMPIERGTTVVTMSYYSYSYYYSYYYHI